MPVESVIGIMNYQLAPATEAQNEQRQHERSEHNKKKKTPELPAFDKSRPTASEAVSETQKTDAETMSQIVDSSKVIELISQSTKLSIPDKKSAFQENIRRKAIQHYRQNSRTQPTPKTPE